MKISKKASRVEPSVTLAASAKAQALKAAGSDVLSLTVGEPDFSTPKNIQEAAILSIKSGKASYYTGSTGLPELKQAVIERTKIDYGLTYEPKEVIITTGAKFALYALFQVLLDPDDEVIIPVPYWVSYGEQVKLADGVPIYVKALQENDYKITLAQLESVRTEKTQAIILNSPSNPTGTIYTKTELTEIGRWAVKHNIVIVSDDIYGKLVYNDHTFVPISSVSEEIRKQTIVINGVSKSYAMTGWRIGYALGQANIIAAMGNILSQTTSNPATASQYAALEALNGTQETVEKMRKAFEMRLNTIYPKITALPGFSVKKPQGAFYLFPNIQKTLQMCHYQNVDDFVNDLLEESQVAVVTGAGFGSPENIRLSYATNLDTLEEAVRRISDFIESKIKEH